jgi:hypothetical protein
MQVFVIYFKHDLSFAVNFDFYLRFKEARKSPALDGVVERDEHGKEVRYPVMLRTEEKIIAKKIVLAFKVHN